MCSFHGARFPPGYVSQHADKSDGLQDDDESVQMRQRSLTITPQDGLQVAGMHTSPTENQRSR